MSVKSKEIIFSQHAIRRMFERAILTEEVRSVIEAGEIIEEYLDDKPYPSYLLLGFANQKPIHVVVAVDGIIHKFYVITVYTPDSKLWRKGYKKRRII